MIQDQIVSEITVSSCAMGEPHAVHIGLLPKPRTCKIQIMMYIGLIWSCDTIYNKPWSIPLESAYYFTTYMWWPPHQEVWLWAYDMSYIMPPTDCVIVNRCVTQVFTWLCSNDSRDDTNSHTTKKKSHTKQSTEHPKNTPVCQRRLYLIAINGTCLNCWWNIQYITSYFVLLFLLKYSECNFETVTVYKLTYLL